MSVYPILLIIFVAIDYFISPKQTIDLIYLISYVVVVGLVFFAFPNSFKEYPSVVGLLFIIQTYWYHYARRIKNRSS